MSAESMMTFGMPAGPANLIAALPARLDGLDPTPLAEEKVKATHDLMALGIHAALADVIVENGTEAEMRAFGMHFRLATAVKAVVDA